MAEKNKKQLTPFEKEQVEIARQILEYKKNTEANIVSILYKAPDKIFECGLIIDDFSENVWKVYFQIAHDIIILEKKEVLDDITIATYLEKHHKLKTVYNENGGYNMIQDAMEYVQVENFEGYITELKKFKVLIKMCQSKILPLKDRLSEYMDMTTEEIYNEYETIINSIFSNVDSDIKSYQITDNIYELIDKLDIGITKGLPYYSMPILTNETGGQYLGSITLLGGMSNAGKSTVARSTTIPSIIKLKQKIIIMVNEDSVAKWQREMLVWVCNNILKFDIQKHTVRDGKYTSEIKQKLREAADWLVEQTQDYKITIIPFLQYKTSNVIKQIRKYAAMGVKYFILDTFKMDAGKVSANSWLEMQQSMVSIKDTVKTEALNVHILITFQLEKSAAVMRYYTQNNIGLAKNIIDVASTCIMIRDVFADEYTGEKRELKVYRLEGVNGKTKIPVKLEKDKKYQIFFIVKNQEGAANSNQIVVMHDKSRNIIEEIGVANIMPDGF